MITPIPPSPAGDILPQKGSSVGIYDSVYATSSMDLRPGYFNKNPRVPLHPIQPSWSVSSPELGPPPPLASKCFPPPGTKGETHSPAGGDVGGGPNSDDWRKSLAFCLLLLCGTLKD